jgi:hypothetical protein
VAVGDFDGDSDPDLAVANAFAGSVSVLLGQPGGGFAPKSDFATGPTPVSVAVGDFNGDSDPDLAVANSAADSVSVLINTSPPAVSLSPSSLSFPATPVGQLSGSQSVTVANTGEGSLEVTGVTIAGLDAEAFRLRGESCTDARVRPGGSCTILVRFAPVESGPASATLRIADSAPDSPRRVPLSGFGGTPPPAAAPAFSASPSSLSFGNQRRGTTSASKQVTVTNTGTAPLSISSVALAGANPGDYLITSDGCGGQTLAPGGSCTVSSAFRPTASGPRTASLRFTDNAPGSPHSVALSGRGCAILIGTACL